MEQTEAWVLHAGPGSAPSAPAPRGELRRERFSFSSPNEEEALVEPLFGSWEANIEHALSRQPIDVCRLRQESAVVLGNLGIVRVLRSWSTALEEGTVCMVMPFGKRDRFGYAETVFAYEEPHTIGLLAKRTKIQGDLLLPVPEDSPYALPQWAAYARYFTAWDNWHVARRCWRAQLPDADPGDHLVFGWGGGVVLAEMELARREGFRVAMTASSDSRLDFLAACGVTPVDRRAFPHLSLDPEAGPPSGTDRERYRASEREFLRTVGDLSEGAGASVFVDNIGAPLHKATVKALSREGVLTTVGWKAGMRTFHLRASECIRRHLHVNTHVWRYADSPAIRDHQERTGWIPSIDPAGVYDFDEVPQLVEDYAAGKVAGYFPLYRVNPV